MRTHGPELPEPGPGNMHESPPRRGGVAGLAAALSQLRCHSPTAREAGLGDAGIDVNYAEGFNNSAPSRSLPSFSPDWLPKNIYQTKGDTK